MRIVRERSVAVISLQRLGDVLTGARVTDAWSQRANVDRLEVLHWDSTRDAAALLPGATHLHGIPHAALRARGRMHPLAAYDALAAIMDGIGRHRFDTVVNLSSTRFACLLAPMLALPTGTILGPWIDDRNEYQASHAAIEFLNAWGVDPELNVFSHQDLYATAARVRLSGYPGLPADPIADTLVAHTTPTDASGPIALHIHGSEPAKDWRPAESSDGWAGVARAIRERLGRPVLLLGSNAMLPELERVAAASGAEVAAWPLRHTGALLRQCSGLISVDTVAIHLAAQVECPTIVLRQGPAAGGLAFVPGPNALLVDPGSELATVADVVRLAGWRFLRAPIPAASIASMVRRIRVRESIIDNEGYLGAVSPTGWPVSESVRTVEELEQMWRVAWAHHFRGDPPPAKLVNRLQRFAVVDGTRWNRSRSSAWLRSSETRRAA